jgi:hypothetical protein
MKSPETLESYLASNHAPCPSCGYDLHGVRLNKCPECAMPLDLEIVRIGPVRTSQPDEMAPPKLTRQQNIEGLIALGVLVALGILLWLLTA